MNFFKNSFSKLTEKTADLYKTTKSKLQQTSQKVTQTVKDQKALYLQIHPTTIRDFMTEIIPRVFYMPFPEKGVIKKYSSILNSAFEMHYKIWNVSEYSYDTTLFDNQVMEYINTGYPNPSLVEIFMICKEMINWLDTEPGHIVIIHCQKSKSRTALVLSCLLYNMGIYTHPCEGLTDICNKLSFSDESFLKTCNHIYAGYYALMFSSMQLNNKKVKIKKIILSEAPKIKIKSEHKKESSAQVQKSLRPYVQFFNRRSIIYNSIETKDQFPNFDEGQPIIFKMDVEGDGDILIRIRHFLNTDIRYPVMRIMLNTCMLIDQNTRFYSRDLDLGEDVEVVEDFYVDVIIEKTNEESETWAMLNKIRKREKVSKKSVPPKLHLLKSNSETFVINDSPYSPTEIDFGNTKLPEEEEESDDDSDDEPEPVTLEKKQEEKKSEPEPPKEEIKEEEVIEKQVVAPKEELKEGDVEPPKEEEIAEQKPEEENFTITDDQPEESVEEKSIPKTEVKEEEAEKSSSEEEDSSDEGSGEAEIDMEEYLKNLEKES